MAVEGFFKCGTLKGESVVKGFEDQIQILSWSWGVSQSGTTHMASGGGAGKVNVSDLHLTHYVDAASPNLFLACCTGTHYDSATLTMRKAGGTALEYLTLTLSDVIVTSVSVSGSTGGDLLSEDFTVNFGKYKMSYQPQDNKGAKKGGAIDATYDIAKNTNS
jgi:type VI secretion system secreted protein Hcp